MQHRPLLLAAWLVALGLPAGASFALPPGYTVVDLNSGPDDPQFGFEPSIAVDPNNSNNIAITSPSPWWSGVYPNLTNHGIWQSLDGGATWTRQASIPAPPGRAEAKDCPCDQTIDAERGGLVVGTFLSNADPMTQLNNIFTGISSNLAQAGSWNWYTPGGTTQTTNNTHGVNNVDQPWVMVNRDPVNPAQDNVYVSYHDNTDSQVRVAVSKGVNPPNFTQEASAGVMNSFCFGPPDTDVRVNTGARLAGDPNNGMIYCIWQLATHTGADGTSTRVSYMLNRSIDAGTTWTLNGSAGGIQVDFGDSDQTDECATNPTRLPKFGGVNALKGGIDTVAVDPTTGDVIYVYGKKLNTHNQLFLSRIKAGNPMVVGAAVQITTDPQDSALPGVAVTLDGVIGVLYDSTTTPDPISGLPRFTVHLNTSLDGGVTFAHDTVLATFTSPSGDNGDPGQRLMGDYQQLRASGTWFFGTFIANRNAFGGNANVNDPVFVKAPSECQ